MSEKLYENKGDIKVSARRYVVYEPLTTYLRALNTVSYRQRSSSSPLEEVRKFTTTHGMPNNVVCGLCTDQRGNIWLSTYMGISRYDTTKESFINYYAGDGLQGNTGVNKNLNVWITDFSFSVRAMSHGIYSDVRTVDIIITPPWHQTWWAYCIYVTLAALLVWGGVNALLARVRHRRELMKREHAEQLNEAKLQFFINLSPRDFIKNIRLQQAACLLTGEKRLSVSDVAYAIGYTNLSHFSNSFKEKYGMTPTEFSSQK